MCAAGGELISERSAPRVPERTPHLAAHQRLFLRSLEYYWRCHSENHSRTQGSLQGKVMTKALICCGLTTVILGGCSSIIEGTSQQLVVSTNPPGADCALVRQDVPIARINPTPGAATIEKTKYDITVSCEKEGFEKATYLNHSGADGATFGNIILGGGIGWAIDSASGADNKYDSPVNLTLVPKVTVQGGAATTAAAQPSGSTAGAGAGAVESQPSNSIAAPAANAPAEPLGSAPALGATSALPQSSTVTSEPKE